MTERLDKSSPPGTPLSASQSVPQPHSENNNNNNSSSQDTAAEVPSTSSAAAAATTTTCINAALELETVETAELEQLERDKDSHGDRHNNGRLRRLTQFMELLPISVSVSCKNLACSPQQQQQQQQQQHLAVQQQQQQHSLRTHESLQQATSNNDELYPDASGNLYRSVSFHSEEFLLDIITGELLLNEANKNNETEIEIGLPSAKMLLLAETGTGTGKAPAKGTVAATQIAASRRSTHKDEFGTQRVYKKTSPNCVLTLYLPTREITLTGSQPSVLRGIVHVDPKAIQGYRVYAQLTLTFRYGREDEEVMGLRFCNEAIMSLHQIWPRIEEPSLESLSPLQEALVKRLGDGAHPFTLSLTSQAPPSVQLVPAKKYYGAPIGTSYDVRCFIADKTDEKFHRRASVKMGVRVLYRTDVFQQHNGPDHFATLGQGQAQAQGHAQSPPMSAAIATPPLGSGDATGVAAAELPQPSSSSGSNSGTAVGGGAKSKVKSERGDSFPKLRLSPKSFRFSGRFGRSKSEIEKCPNDPFHSYSKSFQEQCDSTGMLPPSSGTGITGGIGGISVGPCGGPQGAVDKPFLLQDGRVGLRASLDKAWYTHGEEVHVTVGIRNDSRKTVRKVRVCAIQHVDVCMFNNGKFKNVVADSDNASPAVDRIVPPGGTLNTTVVLRPQRGPTKNWIALEDTLQRSTEPDEITGAIAASAIRSPNMVLHAAHLLAANNCSSPAVAIPHPPAMQAAVAAAQANANASGGSNAAGGSNDDRNVFAIYVSYYVKVKLTLSGMGGELSLKLPFVLVHVDESLRPGYTAAMLCELRMEKLALHDVPANRKNGGKQRVADAASANSSDIGDGPSTSAAAAAAAATTRTALDRIESVDDELNIRVPVPPAAGGMQRNGSHKRRQLLRSETLARDLDEGDEQGQEAAAQLAPQSPLGEQLHVVQVHQPEKCDKSEKSQKSEKSEKTVDTPRTPTV